MPAGKFNSRPSTTLGPEDVIRRGLADVPTKCGSPSTFTGFGLRVCPGSRRAESTVEKVRKRRRFKGKASSRYHVVPEGPTRNRVPPVLHFTPVRRRAN